MADVHWPEPDAAADLHRRLAAGDPLAPSDFAAAFLDPLVGYLRAARRDADDHLVVQAAEDAVLSVIRNPAVYNPALRDLPGFLRMAAHGDLKNAEAKERRHHHDPFDADSVELPADHRNRSSEGDDGPFDDPRLAAVIAEFTAAERQVFELVCAGERRTEVFAAVLGVADRSADEQEREVHRVKDRIKRRLKRAAEGP